QQLDEVKDKQKDTKRQQDADRIKFRRQILEGADVICSTLCQGRETSGRAHSLRNRDEVDIALAIYGRLRRQWGVDLDYRVGIISPYKDQVNALRSGFEYRYDQDISNRVDFNTVDGFQGQEKDIIIFSCVRSGDLGSAGQVGFLRDPRRANVALTRAKSNLFIIGNAPYLRNDPVWGYIVWHAEDRKLLHEVDVRRFETPVNNTVMPQPPVKGRGQPPQHGALQKALWSAGMLARKRFGSDPQERPYAPQSSVQAKQASDDDEEEEDIDGEVIDPYWAAEDAALAGPSTNDAGAGVEQSSDGGDSLWGDDSDKDEPMTGLKDEPMTGVKQEVGSSTSMSANSSSAKGKAAVRPTGMTAASMSSSATAPAAVKRPAPVAFDPFGSASGRPEKVARKGPGASSVASGSLKQPTTAKAGAVPAPPPGVKVRIVPSGGSTRPASKVSPVTTSPPLGLNGKVDSGGAVVGQPAAAAAAAAAAPGAPPAPVLNGAIPSANALSALFVKKRK
ncbi:unnamed protein product, partial [Tilletia controversa]